MKILNVKTITAILVCVLLVSCSTTKKQYNNALQLNSIESYEGFLFKFPKSKYKYQVQERLNILYDEQAYKNAVKNR